jgi:hypothetical protein
LRYYRVTWSVVLKENKMEEIQEEEEKEKTDMWK